MGKKSRRKKDRPADAERKRPGTHQTPDAEPKGTGSGRAEDAEPRSPESGRMEIREETRPAAPTGQQDTDVEKPREKKRQSAWWVTARAELPAKLRDWFAASFGLEPRIAARIFYDGLFAKNPVLLSLLGLCSVLAMSATVQTALGLGLVTTGVLLCSNLVLSLLRRRIPQGVGFVCSVIVVAGFATAADLLMQAYAHALSGSLGIFVPLIAVNGLLLTRAAPSAVQLSPGYALVDGLSVGLGYTVVLTLLGLLRELIGGGTLMGVPVLGDGFRPVGLLALPAGGFLLLGGLVAGFRLLTGRKKAEKGDGEA